MADLHYDVVLLGDPIAARDDKLRAVDELKKAELAAVPLLIERLKDTDDAVALDDFTVEHGPMNPGEAIATRVTARFLCELVLYRIIDPEPLETSVALGARSSKTGLDATRPAGGLELEIARAPIAWVRDWPTFWSKHKGETLDAIRRWSRDEIDRLWKDAALSTTTAPAAASKEARAPAAHLPVSSAGPAAALASSTAGIWLDAWNDPALVPARELYLKMRGIYRDAERDIGKRPAARKQLEDAAKREPRLRVHVEHWLKAL
jgi:hypothetical protein